MSDDHTFSFLLEEFLNGKNTTHKGKNFEVLNAGVNSYTPILSFIQLKTIARQLEPDLVVLNLDMGDLIQEVAYRNAATYGADGEITGVDGRKKAVKKIRINDEIVVEADESTVQATAEWLRTHMEQAGKELLPDVPVEVDVKWGKSWGIEE